MAGSDLALVDAAMVAGAPVSDTIPGVLMDMARLRPGHPAIVDHRNRLSYAEVAAQALDLAAALVATGLNKADRVGIWLPNCAEWIVAAMGVQAAGGVIVPLNTRYKGPEITHALGRSRARFLIHAESFLGIDYKAILATTDLPYLERRISVDVEGPDSGAFGHFISDHAANAGARSEAEARLASLSGDDISDIIFTSGTTGAPKGVVTNHRQNVRTYVEWVRATTLGPEDRFLLIWPMSHCSGYKSGWLAGMIAGATIFPEAILDIERLIARVLSERITFLPGPPPLFQSLLRVADGPGASLPSLRVVGTGGTAIDPALITAIRAELGAELVYAGYGLTECCGTAAMIRREDPHDMVVKSSGRAIDGVELAAMDAQGHILPVGQEGELVTRGFHVMQGYLDDPQATAEAIDGEGWLHTGDLGLLDADGFVHITGRAKEMYIVGGFNCYPAEIENAIQPHPAVREVAVIGVPDERMGEIGVAFIVREPGATTSGEELTDWCRETMANYKVPRHFRFIDALPRNAMGKVEKFRLAGS